MLMNLSNKPEATDSASLAGMGIKSNNLDQSSSTLRMYFISSCFVGPFLLPGRIWSELYLGTDPGILSVVNLLSGLVDVSLL